MQLHRITLAMPAAFPVPVLAQGMASIKRKPQGFNEHAARSGALGVHGLKHQALTVRGTSPWQ